MPAAQYDLVIDQGSDFEISIAIEEDGSPMDLSNHNARAIIRSSYDATQPSAGFVTSKSGSTVTIKLAHTVTKNLTRGTYVYDVEIYEGTSGSETSVTRILQGKAKVTPEVTK